MYKLKSGSIRNISWVILCELFVLGCISCNGSKQPSSEIVHAHDLLKQIEKGNDIYLKNKKIIGKLDFNALPERVRYSFYKKKIVVSSYILFEGCTFESDINVGNNSSSDIVQLSFEGDISFDNCIFKENVHITNAKFNEDFYFVKNVIGGDCDISNTSFLGLSNFTKSVFHKSFSFAFNNVFQNLDLYNIQVTHLFQLKANTLIKGTFLSNSMFSSKIDFSQLRCFGPFTFDFCEIHQECLFSNNVFHDYLYITNNQIEGEVKLTHSSWYSNRGRFQDSDALIIEKNNVRIDDNYAPGSIQE